MLKTALRLNPASPVNKIQFKKFRRSWYCYNNHSQYIHDVENRWAAKLALFERGMDVVLVVLMYDALETVKLQLQLQVGEC